MEENEKLKAVATACVATLGLHLLFSAKRLYPKDVDLEELLRLFTVFRSELESALSNEIWQHVRDQYESPHFELDNLPPCILGIANVGTNYLEQKAGGLEASWELASTDVNKALSRMKEISVFDCRIPHPEEGREYHDKRRSFFVLRQYWLLYREILQELGIAPLYYSPNPMRRFLTNLQWRIERCASEIDDERLLSVLSEALLEPDGSEDFSIDWEYGGRQIVNRCDVVIERVRLEMGSRRYEPTEQEKLFIEAAKEALNTVEERTTSEFQGLLQTIKRERSSELAISPASEPRTVNEYIDRVENELRSLAKQACFRKFGERWLEEVKCIIGPDAFSKAQKTMEKRGVSDSGEFLNYTQFSDLHNLVNKRWNLFNDSFSCRRREFNSLMEPILKGRTEDAHHRPPHLWPQIERDRVKVACHDLLAKICKSGEKAENP